MIYVLYKDLSAEYYWLEIHRTKTSYEGLRDDEIDVCVLSKKLAKYFFGKVNVEYMLRRMKKEKIDFCEVSNFWKDSIQDESKIRLPIR